MKQTAVEWLIENIETLLNYKVKGEIEEDKPVFKMFQQALEMEKQQKEKVYSEEEVIAIVEKSRETGLTAEYLLLTEQFKKK
jgi:hypothetical protein